MERRKPTFLGIEKLVQIPEEVARRETHLYSRAAKIIRAGFIFLTLGGLNIASNLGTEYSPNYGNAHYSYSQNDNNHENNIRDAEALLLGGFLVNVGFHILKEKQNLSARKNNS